MFSGAANLRKIQPEKTVEIVEKSELESKMHTRLQHQQQQQPPPPPPPAPPENSTQGVGHADINKSRPAACKSVAIKAIGPEMTNGTNVACLLMAKKPITSTGNISSNTPEVSAPHPRMQIPTSSGPPPPPPPMPSFGGPDDSHPPSPSPDYTAPSSPAAPIRSSIITNNRTTKSPPKSPTKTVQFRTTTTSIPPPPPSKKPSGTVIVSIGSYPSANERPAPKRFEHLQAARNNIVGPGKKESVQSASSGKFTSISKDLQSELAHTLSLSNFRHRDTDTQQQESPKVTKVMLNTQPAVSSNGTSHK